MNGLCFMVALVCFLGGLALGVLLAALYRPVSPSQEAREHLNDLFAKLDAITARDDARRRETPID
jgi:hypothetical protein